MSAVDTLSVQLRAVFGDRLQALLGFDPIDQRTPADSGEFLHTLAVVDRLTLADLSACASLSAGWRRLKLEMPLFIAADELSRSLDVFPLEFRAILATRRLIAGADPFGSIAIADEDLRRACEVQAKSHLLHLREGYVEAGGRRKAIATLVADSVTPFRALLLNVVRLEIGDRSIVDRFAGLPQRLGFSERIDKHLRAADRHGRVKRSDQAGLYPEYLHAAERLAEYVDRWKRG